MNKIHNEAKKLYRSLKGNINIPSLIKYIEKFGYSVVFFHTEEGDEILRAYGLTHEDKKAFTYCGTTKMVFIDGNLPTRNQIYSLLHECGHISLRHIGDDDIDLFDSREIENEAEAFAYTVLNYHKIADKQFIPLFVAGGALILMQGIKLYNLKRARRAEG